MRRELHYFDIFPKTVPAGETSVITVKYLERRFHPEEGRRVKIKLIPMTESLENRSGCDYDTAEAVFENRTLTFSYRFGNEQEYGVCVYLNEDEYIRLSVYALAADLYARRPLKGDFHVHSNYSDGWESPERVAAYYREAGYDFTVISDHRNYQGSVAAKDFYKDVRMGLLIVNGEEVHAPGNHIHIVNFGSEFSVNEIFEKDPARYEAEVQFLAGKIDPALVFEHERDKYEYAASLWIYDQIKRGRGLSIYAHPHWIVDAYHVRDSMTLLQFKNKCFDAFELVGGMSPKENNMQLALYHSACKAGYGDFPIVGCSDSHGVVREPFVGSAYGYWNNEYGFDELFSIVFAASNDKDDIIDAVKKGYSVAVDRYKGETPRVYGDYRMVSYALFLLSEYFPLHDDLCREEGRLMKQMAGGAGPETALVLEKRSRVTEDGLRKYFK